MNDLWTTPVILTGKFVRLEPMTEAHIPALAAVGLDDRIWEHMLYGRVQTEADMRVWVLDILNRQAQGTDLAFVAVDLTSGRVAGATRYLNMSLLNRNLEIGGTWYGLEFQRTVVNTECKYLLLKYAFETLHCIRVQFKADARNAPSLRAIERIGAKWEGVLRNHLILPDGRYRDSVFYSIIDNEWPDIKDRLDVMLSGQ